MTREPDDKIPMAVDCCCPGCGKNFVAMTPTNKSCEQVTAGDIGICFHCGVILEFDANLHLQLARNATVQAMPNELYDLIRQESRKIVDGNYKKMSKTIH